MWIGGFTAWFFQLAALVSNICLCHDLIQTLKSPFDVAGKRLNKYLAIILVVPLATTLLVYCVTDQHEPTEIVRLENYIERNNQTYVNQPLKFQRTYNFFLVFYYEILLLYAFYSLIFALKRLFRKGVSYKVRTEFLKKHTLYVITVIVVWTLQIGHNFKSLFPQITNSSEKNNID